MRRLGNYVCRHKVNIIFIVTICFVITFLTLGYSSFGSNLYVSDILLDVRIEANIRISGIEVDNVLNNGVSNYEDYNVSSISSGVSLPDEDSSVTYKIKVTNIGNAEMGVLDITGISDNLEYELVDYTLKDKLCDSDEDTKCSLGAVTYFYITIKYRDGCYDGDSVDYNIVLDFDFRQFYGITYNNITNNNYVEEVLGGDDLEVVFVDDIPSKLSVVMNDVSLVMDTDYTYNDGTLIIGDVSGDIVINGYYSADSDNISSLVDSLDGSGGYIEVTGDIVLEESLTFDSGGDVTLDLSSSEISSDSLANGGKLIVVSGSTNLTIVGNGDDALTSNEIGIYMDSSFTGTVTLENVTITTSGDAAVRNAGTGVLIVNNCIITSTEWAGINNLSTGTVLVYDSTIQGNNYAIKTDGGGISTLYSGIFIGGTSAIYNSSGTTTIYGGSYSDTSFINYLADGYTYSLDDSSGYYVVSDE